MKETDITLEAILRCYQPDEQELIKYSYHLAEEALKDKVRENKKPFIEHPLGVAYIVSNEIGLRYESVAAVFLHEAIRFNPDILPQIPKGKFSDEIINIALSLNKIAAIKPKETRLEAENYKRLILSYSKDPRVTLIKLADRLEVMRNIYLLPKSSQERKVTETMLLYIPIAHQLGLYNLKSELENIFFKYTDPEHFREITNKLKATQTQRDTLAESFIKPLKERIAAEGFEFSIKQRTKTAYSIWKKMEKQKIDFDGVKDVLAIRIIIKCDNNRELEHDLCWKVYSIVTEEYTPDTKRLRDWLSKPKENGYESLHTTVSSADGNSLEVQIRTERMDLIAENGNAAHWSYKGIKGETEVVQWLNNVRKALESGIRYSESYTPQYLKEEVFVFTPDGELRRLPKGATVLDFAFDIHTNLGIKCSGAIIDGKAVSIKDLLKTGDIVEIMSNKNQKPSADWLNFVVTSKARSKIRLKLKEELKKRADIGRELLERRLKNWKEEFTDDDISVFLKKYKLKTVSEFYSLIEDETIDIMSIKSYLNEKKNQKEQEETKDERSATASQPKSNDSDYLIIDGKLGNVGYKMAKCCNPIFGDEVFGFVSIKDGIKIHRLSCPNAARLIENYPYRIQKVKWRETVEKGSFQTTIKVIIDDAAIYPKLLEMVTGFGASLRSSSFTPKEGRNKGDFDVKIQVYVSSNQILDKIISNMRKTKGVYSALRISQ
ncbi:MAG: bifunctional (p)ppGpp synthetase/guanosine-3',5'-bis(diphosphate) 3'-pyrophosphohydrolase [Bacteroidales bacterium]|nr:bifunctional (p)ppGpp synthetase/guanosine-3',5'-bis(diphosphate) 3'-pyrophosphohydrolase [Bacteroidales bacterium]